MSPTTRTSVTCWPQKKLSAMEAAVQQRARHHVQQRAMQQRRGLSRQLMQLCSRNLMQQRQPMQLHGLRRLHRGRAPPIGRLQSPRVVQMMQLLARPLLHRRCATQRSLPLDKISQVLSKLSLFGKVRQSQVMKQMQLRGKMQACDSKEPSTPLYPQAPALWQYRYRQKYRRHRPS